MKGSLVALTFVGCVFLGALVIAQALTGATDYWAEPPRGMNRSAPFMIGFIAFTGAWSTIQVRRCSDGMVRRCLVWVAALLMTWITASVIKVAPVGGLLAEYLWYYFYVPFLLLPSIALIIVTRSTNLDRHVPYKTLSSAVFSIDAVFLVLVLTNPLHQWVFDVTYAMGTDRYVAFYSYEAVYFAIIAWVAAKLVAMMLCIVRRARTNHATIAALLALIVVLFAFGIAYVLRVDFVIHSSLTLTFSILTLALFETCMAMGIIPSYTRRSSFYKGIPMELQVLGYDGTSAYATSTARPLGSRINLEVMSLPLGSSQAIVCDEFEPNVRYLVYDVRAGRCVIRQDLRRINAARKGLETRRARLRHRNSLLTQDLAGVPDSGRMAMEAQLLTSIDLQLHQVMSACDDLIAQIAADPGMPEEGKRVRFGMAKLLMAYAKRKGYLIVREFDHEMLGSDVASMVLSETAIDMQAAGMECAALVEVSGDLEPGVLNLLWDCLYTMVLHAWSYENPVILLYLKRFAGVMELSCLMEHDGARTEHAIPVPVDLLNRDDPGLVDLTVTEGELSCKWVARVADGGGGA